MSEFLRSRKRLISILAPTLFGIFYMFLVMFNLQQSVWQGESYGAYLTRYDAGQIWQFASDSNQPPLYFWALKLWAHCFGRTDFAMRFMSAFCGAIALMFAYMWTKYKYGSKAAILGSLLLSFSPILVRYGREMQPFMMALMFVFAAMYFLQLAIDNGQKRWWLVYALMVALGLWTSYYAVFAFLAQGVYLCLVYGRALFRRKTFWLSFAAALLLFVPWLPSLLGQLAQRPAASAGISLATLTDFWSQSLIYQNSANLTAGALLLTLAASVVLVVLAVRYRLGLRLLLCNILVPLTALLLLSLTPWGLSLLPQRVIYSSASIALLGGIATVIATNELSLRLAKRRRKTPPALWRRPRFVFASCAVVLVATSLCGLCILQDYGNYNFDTGKRYSAKLLVQSIASADGADHAPIIVESPWLYYDLSFYDTPEQQSFFLSSSLDVQGGLLSPLRQAYFGRIDHLGKFLAQHEAVWYVGAIPDNGGDISFPQAGYTASQVLTLSYEHDGRQYEAIRFVPE